MLVTINGKRVPLTRDPLEEQLNKIFRELYDRNEIVQEVVVDGTAYRDDYNEHIMRNLGNIRDLQILTVNGAIIAADLSRELVGYLPKLIRAFDSISELLYGEMTSEDWQIVAQLFEGINWVMQSVDILKRQAGKSGDSVLEARWDGILASASGQLAELENHMKQSDHTAAGDLLKYEMPEVFASLLDVLEQGEPA